MAKAVLFDWDGVISYSMKPIWIANSLTVHFYQRRHLTYEQWYDVQATSAVEFFRSQGFDGDLTEVIKKCYAYFDEVVKRFPPQMNPDAPETLQYIASKGLPTGIVSTHPETTLRKEVKRYGLDKYFLDGAIVGDSRNKVDDIKGIVRQLGLETCDVLFIGDTVSDMVAAVQAGARFVGVLGGYNTLQTFRNANPNINPLARLTELNGMLNL